MTDPTGFVISIREVKTVTWKTWIALIVCLCIPALAGPAHTSNFDLKICIATCQHIDQEKNPDEYKACVEDCKRASAHSGVML